MLMLEFKHDRNCQGHISRWIDRIPATPSLFAVVILVVLKPF
jgi:hypothetical protein